MVRDHAAPAKVPVLRLHDPRHSHTTQLLAAGLRPDVVAKRLGHSSIAFTLSTYTRVYEGDQHAALGQCSELTPTSHAGPGGPVGIAPGPVVRPPGLEPRNLQIKNLLLYR